MRFSSLFPSAPKPRPDPRRDLPRAEAEPAPASPAAVATPPPELPEDLDARVRMIGEWQLGEG